MVSDDGQTTTIYDIAREAGVSVSTVSRVLNSSAPVKAETKRKVMAIIEKYNYYPNSLARSLLYKKTGTIGVVLPDVRHDFFSTIFVKIEARALERNYTTFLCNSMNNVENESTHLRNLMEKQVDGIILMGGRVNDTVTKPEYAQEIKQIMQRIPVVFVNGEMEGVDAHIVRTDLAQGMSDMLHFLFQLGHKRIAWLGGQQGVKPSDVKKNVFCEMMRRRGYSVPDSWIIEGGFSLEAGEELMMQLLKQPELPSAVVCMNDPVAAGAIRFLHRNGFRVPDDISIVGFDDIDLAHVLSPEITTVGQDYNALGKQSVDILVNIIEGNESPRETVLPTNLRIRQSCARLPEPNKEFIPF